MRALAILFAFSATIGHAQDHSACYHQETVPTGIRQASNDEQMDVEALAFGYHFIPLYFGRFCGSDEDLIRDYVGSVLSDAGCSFESDVGKEHASFITIDFGILSDRVMGCDLSAAATQEETSQICDMVDRSGIGLPIDGLAGDSEVPSPQEKAAFHEMEDFINEIVREECG